MKKNMKRLAMLSLSLLMFMFVNCEKDDVIVEKDDQSEQLTDLITVIVSDNYLGQVKELNYKGYLFLSTDDGNVFAEHTLHNNETITVQEQFDLNNTYNATFLNVVTYPDGFVTYIIKTFNDIRPDVFNLTRKERLNDLGTFKIELANVGSNVEIITSSHSYSLAINNGVMDMDVERETNSSEQSYFVFQRNTDNYKKYLLFDVESDYNVFDYDKLARIDKLIEINYPNFETCRSYVSGSNKFDFSSEINLSTMEAFNSSGQFLFEVPNEFFDNYKVVTHLKKEGLSFYTKEIFSSLLLSYKIPELELSVENSNLSNYTIKSNSDFDYYSTSYVFYDEGMKFDVVWDVYGEKRDAINFSFPTVNSEMSIEFPDFDMFSYAQLGSSVIKYGQTVDYKIFILSKLNKIENKIKFDIKEESVYFKVK